MQEGSLRFLIGKYESKDLLQGYNTAIQNFIIPQLNIETNIHILDCTDLEVNYFNPHYEQSGISYSKRKTSNGKQNARGYKLSTLRGIVNDSGIIEEIRFGPLNIHDLTLSEEMLLTTKVFKPGDILISDRGFLSRKIINYLKTKRNVDVYIPLKKNMDIYNVAINVAKEQNKWSKHPLRRFSNQKICLVEDLGPYWLENDNTNNVDINGCVVWDETDNEYFVFATTDTSKTASSILLTYNVRSEIEEDYRQLKDFWKIEDFKSTKLNVISFHIVSVLFGYLFFQLYTLFLGGEQYAGKSLPVIMKSYINNAQGYVVIYVGEEFGVLKLIELMELYAQCSNSVKLKIKDTLI